MIVQRAISIDPEKREIRLTKHDPIRDNEGFAVLQVGRQWIV